VTNGIPLLEDLGDVRGKRVLVRLDLNVPIKELPDGRRVVADDFRIRASLPTLRWLREHGAEVRALTHLGRPGGAYDPRYDVAPVRERLQELIEGVELGENLRFSPGEEANSPEFVDELVKDQDLYVNDAFGASHRAHASIVGPPSRLPSAAGRLLAREVEVLTGLLTAPERPFVAVLGGAKIKDKIGVVRAFTRKADSLLIGGGMAFTFLKAAEHTIGSSLVDWSRVEECADLLSTADNILLPVDTKALAPGCKLSIELDPGMSYPASFTGERRSEVEIFGSDLPDGWRGFDIGPATAVLFTELIGSARTVLWNGPMGVFEDERFAAGTRRVAEAVASCPGKTVVGGGDSVAALEQLGLAGAVDHVSTGGGASLELLEHGDLPGLAALRGAPNGVRAPVGTQ
jgi:phosphoglycerate kinase